MLTREEIQQILNKYDLEGLLRMGAPEDEYACEAEDIYDMFVYRNIDFCRQAFCDKVYEYWNRRFGNEGCINGQIVMAAIEIWEEDQRALWGHHYCLYGKSGEE